MSLQQTPCVILESYYSAPRPTPGYNPNIRTTIKTMSLSRGASNKGSDKGAEEASSSQVTSTSQGLCLTSMSVLVIKDDCVILRLMA